MSPARRHETLNDSESELDDTEGINLFQDRPEAMAAEVPTDSDDDSGEELNTHRTRKEQKALERELLWREISRMNPEVTNEFQKAATIEYVRELDGLEICARSSPRRSSQHLARQDQGTTSAQVSDALLRQEPRRAPAPS